MSRLTKSYWFVALAFFASICIYVYLESRPPVYTASYLIEIGLYGPFNKRNPVRLASPKDAAAALDVYLFNDAIKDDSCRGLGYENGMAMRNSFIVKSENSDLYIRTYGLREDSLACVKKVVMLLDSRLREKVKDDKLLIQDSIYQQREMITKLENLNRRIANKLPKNNLVAANLLAPIAIQILEYESNIQNYELALSDKFNRETVIISSEIAVLEKKPNAYTSILFFVALLALFLAYQVLTGRFSKS